MEGQKEGGRVEKERGRVKKDGGGLNRKGEGLKKQGRVEKKGLKGEKKRFPTRKGGHLSRWTHPSFDNLLKSSTSSRSPVE